MASAARSPRPEERRTEPREPWTGARSVLIFRGNSYPAPVLNISSRGTMIECGVNPRLGESVMIHFDGAARSTPLSAGRGTAGSASISAAS